MYQPELLNEESYETTKSKLWVGAWSDARISITVHDKESCNSEGILLTAYDIVQLIKSLNDFMELLPDSPDDEEL